MTQRMHALATRIVELQAELDREIENRRKALGWSWREGLIEFEHGLVAAHRRMRKRLGPYIGGASLRIVATAPVIYSLIVPFVLLDLFVSAYQAICFPAYGIAKVERHEYIAFDRRRLGYLNWIEVLNCEYCAYANGLVAYVREVAARTEEYWCPIKHAVRISNPHDRYLGFLEYGDAEGYKARLEAFREGLRSEAGDEAAIAQDI